MLLRGVYKPCFKSDRYRTIKRTPERTQSNRMVLRPQVGQLLFYPYSKFDGPTFLDILILSS